MSDGIIVSRLEGTKLIVETANGVKEYDAKFLVAALLVYIARGSGQIEPEESAQMIELIEGHFRLQSAQSLELITRAMTELTEKPELAEILIELATTLSDSEKEAIALSGNYSDRCKAWCVDSIKATCVYLVVAGYSSCSRCY